MAEPATTYAHITVDEHDIPWVAGANTKVVELVAEVHAYGWSPEELAHQHPHLSLAQIHSALAYYWDHRDEIEADLRRRQERVDRIEGEVGQHPLVAKLQARSQA